MPDLSLSPLILVCFAVKEEASPFQRRLRECPKVQTLLTGIGRANAQKAIHRALAACTPNMLLTCGFAGALRLDLPSGTVLFAADPKTGLASVLLAAGAQVGRFHCSQGVVCRAKDKRALWEATGADAVEMESEAISSICRAQKIPCATIRVILDTAEEDLPLDFDLLMDSEQRIAPWKLALALLKAPSKIPDLLRLQKQTKRAAVRLADVLLKISGLAEPLAAVPSRVTQECN